MRLTDLSIKVLQSPERGQKTYADDTLPGFGVRVSQGGTKTFVLVHGATRQRETIGRYPIYPFKARGLKQGVASPNTRSARRHRPAITFGAP